MEESGLSLEHPAAATFRQHVLAGDWAKADHDLRLLHDLLRNEPHVEPRTLVVRGLACILSVYTSVTAITCLLIL